MNEDKTNINFQFFHLIFPFSLSMYFYDLFVFKIARFFLLEAIWFSFVKKNEEKAMFH